MAYLSEVAAEYTKRGGAPLAVVVYGSASAVLRHEFRGTTHDIDYSIPEPSIPRLYLFLRTAWTL